MFECVSLPDRGLVKDIPTAHDFIFEYRPTLATLFRFSALMFNAHYIHLDQGYTQHTEGYPGRLLSFRLGRKAVPLTEISNDRTTRPWTIECHDVIRNRDT
jgi:hypothetical protein